jgi:hypothetical protein
MLNKLITLEMYIGYNYIEELSYNLYFNGVHVIFNYFIMLGWGTVYEANKNFDACDYQTNLQGLDDEIKKIYKWIDEHGTEG